MTVHGTNDGLVVGSGKSHRSYKGLFANIWVMVAMVALVFGSAGVYLLYATHADTLKVVAYTGNNDGCGGNATHYNDTNQSPIGTVSKTVHVSQTDFGANSVCKCNNSKIIAYGTAPQSIYMDTTMNPRCNVVAYGAHNDGCGGYATHYNDPSDAAHSSSADAQKTTHVGQTDYGENSICRCDNSVGGMVVAFDQNNMIPDTTHNPLCYVTTAAGTPSTVQAYSGHEDGCGGYATHYNDLKDTPRSSTADPLKTTHVNRTNDGNNSLCKCDNSAGGGFVNFNPNNMLDDSVRNPGCPAGGTPTSGGSGTTGSTGTTGTTGTGGTKATPPAAPVTGGGTTVSTSEGCPVGTTQRHDGAGNVWCSSNSTSSSNSNTNIPITCSNGYTLRHSADGLDSWCVPNQTASSGSQTATLAATTVKDEQHLVCGTGFTLRKDGTGNEWCQSSGGSNIRNQVTCSSKGRGVGDWWKNWADQFLGKPPQKTGVCLVDADVAGTGYIECASAPFLKAGGDTYDCFL